jgi:hypothetical protein
MGPQVNLGLLLEARCRNEHFYVIPNRVTGFNNFNEKTAGSLAESVYFEKRFASVIHTSQNVCLVENTLSHLTTDKCQYIVVTGLN